MLGALGQTTTLSYKPDGRLSSMTNARNFTWNYASTPTTSTITDPLGQSTTTTANVYGVPVRVDFEDATFQTFEYAVQTLLEEAQDLPTRITDENGRARTFSYNGFGQLDSATDLSGAAWNYVYIEDILDGIESPSGERLSFEYDALDDRSKIIFADGGEQLFSYDTARNIDQITLPQGTVLDFSFDITGRETSRTSSLGESRTFSYDGRGNLETLTDSTGTTQNLYDSAGRFTGLVYPSGASVQYGHDLLGRVDRVRVFANATAAAQESVYGYDEVGNLISIADPLGGITTIVYDAANRATLRTLPNGITTTWDYDTRNRIIAITHRDSGGIVLASRTYVRDLSGEPTRITNEDGSRVEIDYDPAWRILEERYFDPANTLLETIAYAYDVDGNRIARTTNAGSESYAYSAGYWLDSVTGGSKYLVPRSNIKIVIW